MGDSFAIQGVSGGFYDLSTQSKWGKTSPTERVWHINITFGTALPFRVFLPDARTVPKGGPLYHFVVTAEASVPSIQWITHGGAGFASFALPISVRWYMVDNSEQLGPDGLWAWKAQGYTFFTETDPAFISSFGDSFGSPGAIDKYSVIADAWSTEPDSGHDWYRAGVSWEGNFALIRKGGFIWAHSAGVTSAQFGAGFANVDKCSFIRAEGTGIGIRHYSFGNFDLGASFCDYYEFIINSVTIFPNNAAVPNWNEGSSAARASSGLLLTEHYIIQIMQFADSGPQPYPAFIFNINSEIYFTIQQTSVPHYQWGPSVTLGHLVHLLGGGSSHTNVFDIGTRWHHAYQAENLAGWVTRAWIPVPLRGHGCQFLPTKAGRNRCLFGMGKDHSFFPQSNVLGWIHDNLTESFVVAGSSAWDDRREQNVSWGQLD